MSPAVVALLLALAAALVLIIVLRHKLIDARQYAKTADEFLGDALEGWNRVSEDLERARTALPCDWVIRDGIRCTLPQGHPPGCAHVHGHRSG